MPRPKTISDDDILAAAKRCFRERGHSVSTREVAKAAGVSQAVLFQRFGDKHQMFLRAMMPTAVDVDELFGAPPEPNARRELHLILSRLVQHFERAMPSVVQLLAYPGVDLTQLAHAHESFLAPALIDRLRERLNVYVFDGQVVEGALDAGLASIIAASHFLAMQRLMSSDAEELDEAVGASVEVLWSGLAPRL